MYTLLVSGAAREQDSGTFKMDVSRFLEYTDDAIVAQLKSLSLEAAACLQSWPCVLMDEGYSDEIVKIGRIVRASISRREISLDFEPLDLQVSLANDDLLRISSVLDIGEFEFSRNHISVKDRDLLLTLSRAGHEIGINPSVFAPLPLPAPARAELLKARDVIGAWGHTDIDDLMLDIGIPELGTSREPGSRKDRANSIARFALNHPGATTADNHLLSAYLVRKANVGAGDSVRGSSPSAAPSAPPAPIAEQPRQAESSSGTPNRVFVVHGRNDAARSAVVEHLRAVGLVPIVLHEQPNMGQHLLTKFVREAELVTFAVVLMTDDDVGGPRDGAMRARARQNVILELGYFLAYLRQHRVCALVTPGLETPSDFDGIAYIEMDGEGRWREELTRELRAADMPLADLKNGTA